MVTPPRVHQDPRYQLLGTYAKASYRPVSEEIDKIRDSSDLSRARQFVDQAKQDHPSRMDLWQKHEELLQEAHGQVLRRKLSDINRQTTSSGIESVSEARVRYVPVESATIGWSPDTIEKIPECIVAYITYRVGPNEPLVNVAVPSEDRSFRVGETWMSEGKLFYDRLQEIRKLWRRTKFTPIFKPNDIRRTSYVEQPDDFDKNGFKQWLMLEWSIKLVEPTPDQQAEIRKLGGKDIPHRLVRKPTVAGPRSASRKASTATNDSRAGSSTFIGATSAKRSSTSSSRTSSRQSSISTSRRLSRKNQQQ